ncbi:MAG: triose-phosphate isomerase family protein [Bacilli bacterium]|jgi:triosephosphate isomerase|nr:triose-phosphate isomerase family protein [Bacilli bacterium]
MKRIFLNLKRFDIPREFNGINDIFRPRRWGKAIARLLEEYAYEHRDLEIVVFFPEGHLLKASRQSKYLAVGCQGVHYRDVAPKGNFGAFTTMQTATSATSLGASWALIGHSEERKKYQEIIAWGNGNNYQAIDEILNQEVTCAVKAGMKVLFCVGEKAEEQANRYQVLQEQITHGLKNIDPTNIVIAYEPIWAIGPGKTPPTAEYIAETATFIKKQLDVDVVYGGGLKLDNAAMFASIKEISGGLIALTNFGENFGFSTDEFINIVNQYLGENHES